MGFKQNQSVRATSPSGARREGRFVGTRDLGPGKGRGLWVDVNVGQKGAPEIKSYRPAAVAPA